MPCKEINCPYFQAGEAACGISLHFRGPQSDRNAGIGLVSASLDIGRELAGLRRVSFAAKGTCMYPCIKQGDTLFIDPCSVEDARVGDIAVIRRNGALFGHRIISKGIDVANGSYIVTRPDRSNHGSDGPTFQGEMLGIVSSAERNGRVVQLNPVSLQGVDLLKVSLWEWWQWTAKPELAHCLFFIQQLLPYRRLASLYLRMRYPSLHFSVHLPLKPMQQTNLFRICPVSDFDINAFNQRGQPVVELMVQLKFQAKAAPAASVTLFRRPDDCPEGGGWHLVRFWCRIRYRGADLESLLIEETRAILGRSGASLCCHR